MTRLFPETRFFKASQQPDHIVANHSTLREDLYVIYAGRNAGSDKPIIKVFINPLVKWIWIGAFFILFGTAVALIPSTAAATVTQPHAVPARTVATPLRQEAGAGD